MQYSVDLSLVSAALLTLVFTSFLYFPTNFVANFTIPTLRNKTRFRLICILLDKYPTVAYCINEANTITKQNPK